MSNIIAKQKTDEEVVSGAVIRGVLDSEKKAKDALAAVEGGLDALKADVSSATDQVASAMRENRHFKRYFTTALRGSPSFRRKVSKEILAYLLEKEEKGLL